MSNDAHQSLFPPVAQREYPTWGMSGPISGPQPTPIRGQVFTKRPRQVDPATRMTLDEAIRHAEEKWVNSTAWAAVCAADHRLLAEWLRELKQRRLMEE